ncbi:related to tRNA threonylcarbamoyladenosine biosynthesis protein SUA5 [Saccharomycodes ludwigii]|uniref:Threonylcarbamoyl-AMP synthase n=1 Tax=Saccharomycodes ludwigii TaxID=36035 RepID=A0A376B393_9ASCO|nr:hypothetical protein SCDLUD_000620 [Saccharomycodes ludwigii]KAH3903016.1 hypothetical protein SCDLUD_000620 [Saccharomycodes ludwigii]SSD59082.1 related to tRNA threonylcarbamoyladenosine biosynthesis protein SUA5 [Saccharomycodes ludwigii]
MSSSTVSFQTKILKVNPESIIFPPNSHITGELPTITDPESEKNLWEAINILKTTEYNVAFPTETVYGLAGSALNDNSILNIYKAKNRPSDNPLITHISSLNQLNRVIFNDSNSAGDNEWRNIPEIYHELIRNLWPGPLTILLKVPKNSNLSKLTTANQPTFAVRLPNHPVARALIALGDIPLAAPSANTSTKPSPTLAQHVYHDLLGKIPLILDSGACDVGVESTVVDGLSMHNEDIPLLLRPGGFSLENICKMGGFKNGCKVESVLKKNDKGEEIEKVRTPGMKYKHYSPNCKTVLFVPFSHTKDEDKDLSVSNLEPKIKNAMLQQLNSAPEIKKVGILTSFKFDKLPIKNWFADSNIKIVQESLGHDGKSVQSNLFRLLRKLDEDENVDILFVEGVGEENEGLAIMNRLNKAAAGNIINF